MLMRHSLIARATPIYYSSVDHVGSDRQESVNGGANMLVGKSPISDRLAFGPSPIALALSEYDEPRAAVTSDGVASDS